MKSGLFRYIIIFCIPMGSFRCVNAGEVFEAPEEVEGPEVEEVEEKEVAEREELLRQQQIETEADQRRATIRQPLEETQEPQRLGIGMQPGEPEPVVDVETTEKVQQEDVQQLTKLFEAAPTPTPTPELKDITEDVKLTKSLWTRFIDFLTGEPGERTASNYLNTLDSLITSFKNTMNIQEAVLPEPGGALAVTAQDALEVMRDIGKQYPSIEGQINTLEQISQDRENIKQITFKESINVNALTDFEIQSKRFSFLGDNITNAYKELGIDPEGDPSKVTQKQIESAWGNISETEKNSALNRIYNMLNNSVEKALYDDFVKDYIKVQVTEAAWEPKYVEGQGGEKIILLDESQREYLKDKSDVKKMIPTEADASRIQGIKEEIKVMDPSSVGFKQAFQQISAQLSPAFRGQM